MTNWPPEASANRLGLGVWSGDVQARQDHRNQTRLHTRTQTKPSCKYSAVRRGSSGSVKKQGSGVKFGERREERRGRSKEGYLEGAEAAESVCVKVTLEKTQIQQQTSGEAAQLLRGFLLHGALRWKPFASPVTSLLLSLAVGISSNSLPGFVVLHSEEEEEEPDQGEPKGVNYSPGMAAVLPRTLGELQLYRILQRANLLYYYEAFIQQGGDDVQQLCEAGEEEFLEIMALVGMASKPLHLPEGSPTLLNAQDRANTASVKIPKQVAAACSDPGKLEVARDKVSAGSPLQGGSEARFWSGHSNDSEHSLSPSDLGSPSSPRDALEALDAAAVQSVLECVDRMAPGLPKADLAEVKDQLKNNKKLAKMIGHIFEMSDEEPRREEEIRKYSAIYGRFDSKRRDGKHLTLHELTVNEAAAQLCMRDMALLTRRDELFGLARQISREVTYKYTYRTSKSRCGDRDEPSPKRIKTEENFFDIQEALQAIHMRQEMLREQLACAKLKGEETVGRNLQIQLERLLARQMEILQDAAVQERLQALDWRIPPAALKYLNDVQHTNGAAADASRDHQDERPINLRVVSQSMQEGDLPLGKQLANELKRHHNHNHNNNNNNTEETKTPATENGTSQRAPSSAEKKTIKEELQSFTVGLKEELEYYWFESWLTHLALGTVEVPLSKAGKQQLRLQVTDDDEDVLLWQRPDVGGSTGGGWKPAAKQRGRDLPSAPITLILKGAGS
ncbi:unnamed protein product [Pleuronectes platessa]|uniref:NGFI-A-binding protein 1 n=1 Tax=Pleuronectes platessa TaxID=8262 RepID=A0A9N7YQZ3_PLEPL|nr:unnamed protein product [Pleuronectes platessa]